jgi:hypothetical protein
MQYRADAEVYSWHLQQQTQLFYIFPCDLTHVLSQYNISSQNDSVTNQGHHHTGVVYTLNLINVSSLTNNKKLTNCTVLKLLLITPA